MTITPAIAADWLNRNKNNRPISERLVFIYAQDMMAGRWTQNGESIIFDWNGNLLDGQHRLFAVVESGATITSIVVHGVDPATFTTIDVGKKRSASDVLAIAGITSGHNTSVAAAVNIILQYMGGSMLSKYHASHQQIIEYVRANPEIVELVNKARAPRGWTRGYGAMMTGILWLARDRYPRKSTEFFNRFLSGEGLESGSPILALRNRLANDSKLNRLERLALIVQAWNAYVEDRVMTRMQMPSLSSFPEINGGMLASEQRIVRKKRA